VGFPERLPVTNGELLEHRLGELAIVDRALRFNRDNRCRTQLGQCRRHDAPSPEQVEAIVAGDRGQPGAGVLAVGCRMQ
jgi:hypothetical protein